MTWAKGKSGNPKGRPVGCVGVPGKLREMMQSEAPEIIQKLTTMAKEGDTTAARLILSRICPEIKPTNQSIAMRGLDTAGTLTEKGEAVLAAMSEGSLDPATGANILQALNAQSKLMEFDEIVKRLDALEQKHKRN